MKSFVEAAVLVLCHTLEGVDSLVFNKRTEHVEHHKGQICFPGGMRDRKDATLWETALRETHEELGLEPERVTFIRELEKRPTPTGFIVTPFLGVVEGPVVWKPNAREIDEIFSVPLSHFSDPSCVRFETHEWEGREHLMPFYSYKNHVIWGLTGKIVYDLVGNAQKNPQFQNEISLTSPYFSEMLVPRHIKSA